jgi:hypothetical protein
MKRATDRPRRGARAIDVDGQRWWFFVGRGHGLLIWSPSGEKHLTSWSGVTGLDPDTIDRGQWKKTTDGMVKPGQVRGYIRKHLVVRNA